MKFSTATVALLLLACGISLPARAGEHPVPLEKNVDAAKCLECHEDKSKGKNVHSAIAMGCTSCHEVKVEGETTNINLNQPANELCFTCHAKDVKEEDSKHGPWDKGECVLCHDPHQSDFPKQLRAEGNVLCMECHRTRVDIKGDTVKIFESHEMKLDEYREAKKLKLNGEWESGHPLANHPVANVPDYTRGQGAKMQCITCHMPHSSSDDKLGRMVTVKDKDGKEAKMDACNACHNVLVQKKNENLAQIAPEVDKQVQASQEKARKAREEYLKKLPKVAGDERDQQK